MIGVVVAFVTALAWAGSSTLLKYLSSRIDAIPLNSIRLLIGSVVLLVIVLSSGRGEILAQTNLLQGLLVALSGLVAIAVGDTVYISSLSFLDVSRAFPLAQCTFPVMTVFVAMLFFGERFTALNVLGSVLVVLGIYVLTRRGEGKITDANVTRGIAFKGIALAFSAAALWTGGAAILRLGAINMDSLVAAAIRVPTAAMALNILTLSQRNWHSLRSIVSNARNALLTIATGILTYGVAAVGYVTAMQMIGVGRTVVLTASAPLFLLPMSVLALKERPTVSALAGAFVSVAGVCFVVL